MIINQCKTSLLAATSSVVAVYRCYKLTEEQRIITAFILTHTTHLKTCIGKFNLTFCKFRNAHVQLFQYIFHNILFHKQDATRVSAP